MEFRNCPECHEGNVGFFPHEEDFGIYEILECNVCHRIFSPQREEDKFRWMVYCRFGFGVMVALILAITVIWPSLLIVIIPVVMVIFSIFAVLSTFCDD